VNTLSGILLVLILLPLIAYLFFHGHTFMEPVNSFLTQGGSTRIIILIAAAAFLVLLPQFIQRSTSDARDVIHAVHSVTEHGVRGHATVRKVYSTTETLAGNTLYFFDLHVEEQTGNSYSLTVLHPVRKKDLELFIPGTRIPVKTARRDRSMVVFLHLDYGKLQGFLFLNEHSEWWHKALDSKKEITFTKQEVRSER